MKWLFNVPGQAAIYTVSSPATVLEPKEKKRLRWLIAKSLSAQLLPMHACLVAKNGSGVLICGASGVGKSTLTNFFLKKRYTSQANDFVIIREKGKKLYAGALDLIDRNEKRKEIKIDQCYFLEPSDSRDVFKYAQDEAKEFYGNSMKPWNKQTAMKFANSSLFKKLVKMHVGFGNRSSVKRWEKLMEKTRTVTKFESVGIIGLGVIGQDIANLLVTMPKLKTLNLYSPNTQGVKSLALDLRSASSKTKVIATGTLKKCISSSDLLIFAFRSHESTQDKSIQERYGRIHEHAKIVWELSRVIRATKYTGVILVVSNPVDLLSLFTYHFTNMVSLGKYDWLGIFSNQVYGVGLGLDYARLHVVTKKNLELAGEHGDLQWLAAPNQAHLRAQEKYKSILTKVKLYSESIRKWASRTRFGPSHEVYNIVESFIAKPGRMMRLSTASSHSGFWGQPVELTMNQLIPSSRYTMDKKLKANLHKLENSQRKLLIKLTEKLKAT
jgi:malate/lactate dehydrogenase